MCLHGREGGERCVWIASRGAAAGWTWGGGGVPQHLACLLAGRGGRRARRVVIYQVYRNFAVILVFFSSSFLVYFVLFFYWCYDGDIFAWVSVLLAAAARPRSTPYYTYRDDY